MITAQDVKSGYGQRIKKPHTSVLPYLRAQEAEKEKVTADNELELHKNTNSEPKKATDKNDKVELDQYALAKLEILRG